MRQWSHKVIKTKTKLYVEWNYKCCLKLNYKKSNNDHCSTFCFLTMLLIQPGAIESIMKNILKAETVVLITLLNVLDH